MQTVTVQAWANEDQTTTDFEIGLDSRLMLGCEHSPVMRVRDWMAQQGIEDLQDFANYVNGLDFNVEVVA